MSRPRQDDISQMGNTLRSEVQSDAKANAQALFGSEPHGTEDLGQSAYIAFVARNWADPTFRQSLLQRIGPVEFLKVSHLVLAPSQQQAMAAKIAQTGEMS